MYICILCLYIQYNVCVAHIQHNFNVFITCSIWFNCLCTIQCYGWDWVIKDENSVLGVFSGLVNRIWIKRCGPEGIFGRNKDPTVFHTDTVKKLKSINTSSCLLKKRGLIHPFLSVKTPTSFEVSNEKVNTSSPLREWYTVPLVFIHLSLSPS